MALALKVLFLAACSAILWRAEHRTGTLGRRVPLTLRLSYYGLLVAAAAMVWLVLARGYQPDWPSVLLAAAVAAWMWCERRTGGDRRASRKPAATRPA